MLKDDVDLKNVSLFFLIAHGTMTEKRTYTNLELYFPWGLTNFGWYTSGEGFPLYEIYRNYRMGYSQGITKSTLIVNYSVPSLSSLGNNLSQPLLSQTPSCVPEITLTPKDLDIKLCEKMLKEYYKKSDITEDPGILCIDKDTTLSIVLASLSLKLKEIKSFTDPVIICLCCSVKKGDEQSAMYRSEGYVQYY